MLNERQKDLYNYLLNNGVCNVEQIAKALPNYYTINDKSHDKCYLIRNDAYVLNFSSEIDKLIINDRNYNYWVARDEKEANDFKNQYMSRALKSLKKYWNFVKKIGNDKQMCIYADGQINAIDTFITGIKNEDLRNE